MALKRKFLWIANMDTDAAETAFAKHALAMNATGVCIRTSSTRLPGAIARFKATLFDRGFALIETHREQLEAAIGNPSR
jgi:hypothetical protein